MRRLWGWLIGMLMLGTALAQTVTPARYLLEGAGTGAGTRDAWQLELALDAEGGAQALILAPPARLEGGATPTGNLHLRGRGFALQGRPPEPFAEPAGAPFALTTPDGEVVNLRITASYAAQRLVQGPFIAVGSEAPFFLGAPWRELNAQLTGFVHAPAAAAARDAQALAATGDLTYPYTYEGLLTPTLVRPDLLSLLETRSSYAGGAHPNTTYRSLNFWRRGSEVRRLELAALFREGVSYRQVLLAEVTRTLRARGAAWIVDGSVRLRERDLSVFTLSARGLTFAFAPYAVGPYAQGAFFVTVPYARVRGLLEPAFSLAGELP